MTSFKIENDIPIPSLKPKRRITDQEQVLNYLEIGQSFEFEKSLWHKIRYSTAKLKKEVQKEFIIRELSETSYRVWRTK